jgi:cystinosin
LAALAAVGSALGLLLPKNGTLHGRWYPWYRYVSSVIGYCYVVLWSVCFYPQVLLNYRRQSTKGLSPDFAVLNWMGWAYYSAYMTGLYFNKNLQAMYQKRFSNAESTVASNDVAFALHAAFLSTVYLAQIARYGDGPWWTGLLHLKPQTYLFVAAMLVPTLLTPILIVSGAVYGSRWLDYFYILSYFKIFCTLTKYTKQAMLNWRRRSTKGWNIWYNFLECAGGALSMLQVVLDSIDMNDLTGITGNLAKFVLGLMTIFFDVSEHL